jgi:formylglycine-generating enzyme required for sulfatase activity
MISDTVNPQSSEPEISDAEWRIDRFVQRFEPSYRCLAMYAAMPLVLTPELLGYLRTEFLRGQVDWIGESDLLLSDLCRSVGYEQYVLLPDVRAVLLAELAAQYPDVLEKVAVLLIQYLRYLARTNRYFSPREQQAQAWAAMAFITQQRPQVAAEIAGEFERISTGLGEIAHAGSAHREMRRLAKIVQEIATQLQDYPGLVAYAKLVSRTLKSPQTIALEALQQDYRVGNQVLPPLFQFLLPAIPVIPDFPPLQQFEFEVLELARNRAPWRRPHKPLRRIRYEFTVATIAAPPIAQITIAPSETLSDQPTHKSSAIVIQRQTIKNWQYIQDLTPDLTLTLVKIPSGRFLMGAPDDEAESYSDEHPQHRVSVPECYFGKYPITQAQWRFVAELPKVDRDLDPDPAHFKGNNRPVEKVSWHSAIEFCQRLSQYTGQDYRLPSEAEWEYACRAGTTTPFSFGATIDAEIANYRAQNLTHEGKIYSGQYGFGRLGNFRTTTIPVGSLGVANHFGLYDMHGNVWEWCLDHWHDNYQDVPPTSHAWIDKYNNKPNARRLLRGGSWNFNPRYCRSAFRYRAAANYQNNDLGFRVVCSFCDEDATFTPTDQ